MTMRRSRIFLNAARTEALVQRQELYAAGFLHWFAIWALLVLSILQAPASAAGSATRPLVGAVDAVGVTVSDMDRALDFYGNVLGFQKVSDVEVAGPEYEQLQGVFGLRMRVIRLQLGSEFLELTEYLAPRGRPVPVDSRSNDRWFQHIAIVVRDMDRAYQRLRRHKAQHASSGPQRLPEWNQNAAGIEAFYFKDPDGHVLEVIKFPAGKGDSRWQSASGDLFLGIDHTAIVVGDSESSLRFYRDTLGLTVAGGSENYGTEQEHLNNVFGARLRITTLRAMNGPGIELLEYLTPSDGRPMPADKRANDLIHWQTRLLTEDVENAANVLRRAQTTFVSSGATTVPLTVLGFTRGVLVNDPDGHSMELIQK